MNSLIAVGGKSLLVLTLMFLPIAVTAGVSPADPAVPAPAKNRYIGSKACKNCHSATSKGEQFQKWEASKHAKAFATLATEEAKKAAAERNIQDPQKSAECLQCHVTAYKEDPANLKKGFQPEAGVQCESCHGPGENHAKVRLAAAAESEQEGYVKIPEDEIVASPPVKICLECHNEKSPSFKPFCFKKRNSVILHQDPRKARTAEELKSMKECGCGEACACKQAECSKQ